MIFNVEYSSPKNVDTFSTFNLVVCSNPYGFEVTLMNATIHMKRFLANLIIVGTINAWQIG